MKVGAWGLRCLDPVVLDYIGLDNSPARLRSLKKIKEFLNQSAQFAYPSVRRVFSSRSPVAFSSPFSSPAPHPLHHGPPTLDILETESSPNLLEHRGGRRRRWCHILCLREMAPGTVPPRGDPTPLPPSLSLTHIPTSSSPRSRTSLTLIWPPSSPRIPRTVGDARPPAPVRPTTVVRLPPPTRSIASRSAARRAGTQALTPPVMARTKRKISSPRNDVTTSPLSRRSSTVPPSHPWCRISARELPR